MKFRTQYTYTPSVELNDSTTQTRADMSLSPREILEKWSQGFLNDLPSGNDGGYDGDFEDTDDMFDAIHYDLLNRLGMDYAEADSIVSSLEDNIRAYEARSSASPTTVNTPPTAAASAAKNEGDPASPEPPQ